MCMSTFHVTCPRITLTERQARHSAKFQLEGSSARGVWSAGRGVFTIVATTPKFESWPCVSLSCSSCAGDRLYNDDAMWQ